MLPKSRLLVLFPLLLLSLTIYACAGSATPEPTATPTVTATETATAIPESAPEWQPEILWRRGHDGEAVRSVAFTPNGERLAVGLFPTVEFYEVNSGDLIRSAEFRHAVESLDFSPDGAILGAGQGVYGAVLCDAADGSEIQQLHGGYDNVVAFSPDGETVATGNRTGTAWLWNIEDGELVAEFELPEADYIVDLAFSPDGSTLAVSYFDGALVLWDVSRQTIIHELNFSSDQGGRVESIAFSPDGETLVASGIRDENFKHVSRLWNVPAGTSDGVLTGYENTVTSAAFSPDGALLATGAASGDGAVRLWQVSDWTLLHTLEHWKEDGEPDWVTDLAFSPDGRTIAVGTWEGELYLWQVDPEL
ncbi:MAG TPA: WD40 repeat domain-containing protein [Candidatus Sulfomarinibacteraceae bacterium]|nr:WD40 repeat domain-containing protein [Candidatus Sulfomarinibacteraceae bacterium]